MYIVISLSPPPRSPVRPTRVSSAEAAAHLGLQSKRRSIVPELGETSGEEQEVEVR